MTEGELLELALIAKANTLTALSIFVTIASGYLIVAYIAGAKLTRSQLWFINTVFILTMLLVTSASYLFQSEGQLYNNAARELGSHDIALPEPFLWALYIPRIVDAFVIVGCLKFMWDVRHRED